MRQDFEAKTLTTIFDGWGEFLDYALVTDTRSRFNSSREVGNTYFTNTQDFPEAEKLAREGWKEGEEAIKEMSSKLFDVVASYVERENVVYDVEGTGIDVARFLDGEPECWQQFEVKRTKEAGRRLIRVIYNCAASAGIDKNVIMVRGAAVTALVGLLEYAGHGVELTVAEGVTHGGNAAETYVTVKTFEQPLDLSRVAYAVAHPSMLRRHMFAVCERMPEPLYGMVKIGSYGHPSEVSDKGDLYLGRMYFGEKEWRDGLSAQRWVIEELKRQGVHMSEEL